MYFRAAPPGPGGSAVLSQGSCRVTCPSGGSKGTNWLSSCGGNYQETETGPCHYTVTPALLNQEILPCHSSLAVGVERRRPIPSRCLCGVRQRAPAQMAQRAARRHLLSGDGDLRLLPARDWAGLLSTLPLELVSFVRGRNTHWCRDVTGIFTHLRPEHQTVQRVSSLPPNDSEE